MSILKRVLFILAVVLSPVAMAAEWNVVDAGADPEGKKDCTAVFQQLLDEAGQAGGGVVHVPAGTFRIEGNLRMPPGVTLKGTFSYAPSDNVQQRHSEHLEGSVLQAFSGRGNPDGKPFIHMPESNATLQGLTITYPEWSREDVPPVPYPPTILVEYNANAAVIDCCLLNSYEGIRTFLVARFLFRNVVGYPSWRGIYVDFCHDIGRIENCHFWPFGVLFDKDDPYCEWINSNGVAFEFARTDWQYVHNTFCFGYGVGYKFSESEHGTCNGNFLGIGADSCQQPVLVEAAQPAGLLITNGEFVGRWGRTDSIGIDIRDTVEKTRVNLANCSFWGPFGNCIIMDSAESFLTATGCNFLSWDQNNEGLPAVDIRAGRASLSSNTFTEKECQIAVGERTRAASIIGNLAPGGLKVENNAGKRTQLLANEKDSREWTKDARKHYRLDVGSGGDGAYLRSWHQPEKAWEWPGGEGTKRWSAENAMLVLPVNRRTRYTLSMEVYVPEYARSEDAGFYMDGELLAPLPGEDRAEVELDIPKTKSEEITIEIRCKYWRPADVRENSSDIRQMGIGVRSLTMTARSAEDEPLFNANTGLWVEGK